MMDKLSVKALSTGVGVAWGLCMLILGCLARHGWGTLAVSVMSSVYAGFRPTYAGAILGAAWGFIDGAILGAVIALVYNAVASREN
ncbi:MAG: bacteriophage holin [Candidatus Altiarchaeota archaeon]